MHQGNSQVFLTSLNLEDFPYTTFSQIVKEDIAPEAKYPTAWSWIFLIYILASFVKDQLVVHPDQEAFEQTIAALTEMGLMPTPGLQRLIRSTTKKTFKLTIPKFLESSWEKNESHNDIHAYVENLKILVREVRTKSKHVLVVDGLDDIVTSESAQWESLGALVFEVNRLNMLFREPLRRAVIS